MKRKIQSRQSGRGNYHAPLTLQEKIKGVVVIKYVPYNRSQDQLTPTPVCKILKGF